MCIYDIRKKCTYPPLCYNFSQVSWRWCEVHTYICISICCVICMYALTCSSTMLTDIRTYHGVVVVHALTYVYMVCMLMIRCGVLGCLSCICCLRPHVPCMYATAVTIHIYAISAQSTQHGLVLTGLHRCIIVCTIDDIYSTHVLFACGWSAL